MAELRTFGRDGMYIGNAETTLRAAGQACGWKLLTDIDRNGLAAYLERRKTDGAAPRTLASIAATLRQFCRWAVRGQRLDRNPVADVVRIDQAGDRRRKRRALTPDEVGRLLRVAGPRELLYRLALGTGLRRRELQRLQWRAVDRDGPRPCLRLRPEATKSKRADVLPLGTRLARRLRAARPVNVAPTAPVFRSVPKFDPWKADLTKAGIDYGDEATGEIVGFHSLRVTFISELERSGVSP